MTLADEFIRLWRDPSRSCLAWTLIRKLDPQATPIRGYLKGCHRTLQYVFSDGSAIYNEGRGWRIKPTKESPND
jgi:hypothetical protein